MSFATFGGNVCTRGRVQIPNCWRGWVDVETVEPVTLTGAQTLVIGDFSAVTTVISGGPVDGRARYRAVFGHGGWGKAIDEKSYINDAGVKIANVLQDAARTAGEPLGTLPTARVGSHFARAAGVASDVLHLLAPRAWRIDLAGVTQFDAWPTATYEGSGVRVRTDLAAGVVELAVDQIGNLLPGVLVDGRGPANDVEYEFDDKRLTVRVYFGALVEERLDALRAIVAALFPRLRYSGAYDFRVSAQQGERFDLTPARASSGFDPLRRVPTRGHPGIKADVTVGETVAVMFADCDPSRPFIVAHDHPDSPAWRPTLIKAGDGGDFVALKSAVDALQQGHDLHTHPYALGPVPPPTTPIGPLASSELVKVD